MMKNFLLTSLLIIYFLNEVKCFQRCPEHGSMDFPTINYYPDEKFCNVYHKCNCTRTACHAVESHVCPIAKVYSRTEETCLDLEEESCKTTYVQWVQTHSSRNQAVGNITDSFSPSRSNLDFQCTQEQSGKYSDPNICNIFHVCTTRNDRTMDQPFLCPYPTVFKIGPSGKMFCGYPEGNDCQGKAFYHPMENATDLSNNVPLFADQDVKYRLPDNTLMIANCAKEGLYPDSIYCNAYHKCTKTGQDEQYICENQLLFNAESSICDYPINVVCGGKGLLRRSGEFSNGTQINSSTIIVYGTELRPECPSDVSNVLVADKSYCNIFYHCQSGRGSIYMCREGAAFDASNCRSEETVDCEDRLMLTPQGVRSAKNANKNLPIGRNLQMKHSNFILLPPIQNQKEVVNVPFDCRGRLDGHWRDARYCDVFHACLAGTQKRSYGCTQLAERFYFDDVTQKCEFVSRNINGCPTNQYYAPIEPVPSVPRGQLSTEAPTEPWKVFIQSREQFTCADKADGFYASRWCNVFYRCYTGIFNAFLCPKMPSGARLWWGQHGSPQSVPQESAACTWPCETGRRCSSPGGIIVDNGLAVSESQPEAETVFSQSLCVTATSSEGTNSQVPLSTNDGLISINSDVSCIGQADGVFLSSRYCNVFHRCVGGTRRDFRCSRATNTPYDLWWNEQTQQCDWPCRIQCTGPVYGTATTSQQIRSENALFFRHECAGYQVLSNQLTAYSSSQTSRSLTSRLIENPDPNFICIQIGKFPTRRYCNVYYQCTEIGLPPSQTYECVDSFFDRSQGICISKDQVPCLGGIYPFDSIPVDRNPDSLQCSINSGFQLHTSRQFCNIYYLCDGTQTNPTAFRCFNRQTHEEGIYDPFAERCDSRENFNCQNGILNFTETSAYRSLEIDSRRFSDLSTLPCKYDQSYLIEHEQYCNLYHSCKQGEYHLYACIANVDKTQMTSYFYQPNGQCAAPLASLCPRTKTVFSYERLLSNTNNDNFQQYLMPDQPQQNNYGSISIQERVDPTPPCRLLDNYIIPHDRYCNLFYGCKEGELILYACVDRLTNTYGGIFQSSTGNCIASTDCGVKEFFRPNEITTTTLKPNSNVLFRSYTMLEVSNETKQTDETFKTQSAFSCINRPDGYYESEWCNIFYRCVGGRRYDERCSSSGDYDLWWKHQGVFYNRSHPQYFAGLDSIVRCDWPCKIQCQKPIWLSKENIQGNAEEVLKQDQEQRPACLLLKNRKIDHSKHLKQQMIMYSDIPNPSNFTCPEHFQGQRRRFIDTKYCNVFHECTNSKLIGSFLCIESQFDSKESDCVPLSINNNCPIERRFIVTRSSRLATQAALSAYYEAVEVRNVNPSGYECITDGIHTDPMFCNLFHACSGRTRRTFQCRQTGTDGINDGVSTFDLNTKSCTRFSSYSCPTLLYNQEFLILPVMFKPPTVSPCGREGFFPVSDISSQYCHMFAWCPKGHGEAKVFECVPSSGIAPGAFDMSRRSCTSRTSCPHARQSSSYNTTFLATTLKPKIVSINNRKQFSLTSTMLENGYIALGADFQTTFTCPIGSTGFYSNPNYCDVFHYCYETGELASFVCASMPNRYQLWWSHHNEPGRPDNVFCDWPCNLQGVYACPAHKSILMRDRQPNGNIGQNEVLEATCSSAQVPTVPIVVNNYITPEPIQAAPSTFFPLPLPNVNNNPQAAPPVNSGISSTALGYQSCIQSREWFVSQPSIRCSGAFAVTGFAPDPKDCSKYYACDSYIGPDGMAAGILMQCLAGLWWDQQRRTCVLPSEVACNPYNIINSQGQGPTIDIIPNILNIQPSPSPPATVSFPFPIVDTTPMIAFQPRQPSAPIAPAPTGTLCRGVPLCINVGLNILQQMKAIPGRPGWFYKCDSQCALEMRCPPGLVFDDLYQRCEWPGMKMSSSSNSRLGSLRKKLQKQTTSTTVPAVKQILEP